MKKIIISIIAVIAATGIFMASFMGAKAYSSDAEKSGADLSIGHILIGIDEEFENPGEDLTDGQNEYVKAIRVYCDDEDA